jgi:hypothetical protein
MALPAGRSCTVCVHEPARPATIRTIHYVVAEAGSGAALEFPVHPHGLRLATGFYLAKAGQDTRAIHAAQGINKSHSVYTLYSRRLSCHLPLSPSTRGCSDHLRPSRMWPAQSGMIPPHCFKK